MIIPPLPSGFRKESCFSAVIPVIGWNQCEKWVAPLSIAQAFIACATALAIFSLRSSPLSMVFLSSLYTSLGSLSFITSSLNTFFAKSLGSANFSSDILFLFSYNTPDDSLLQIPLVLILILSVRLYHAHAFLEHLLHHYRNEEVDSNRYKQHRKSG